MSVSLLQSISSDPTIVKDELVALEAETAISERITKLLSDENLLHLTKLLRSKSNPKSIKDFLFKVYPQFNSIVEEEIKKVKEKYKL